MAPGPLLVFGPRSTDYDFGPSHPLTPRRFGPGIDLLRELGAEPGLAPQPASDEELLAVHDAAYLAAVRRCSADPSAPPEAGIGTGDVPAFRGMHAASAAVAGGSLRAMESILRGDVEHAFHPGGGLHHAMRDRASGFCVYDDPALAIARARSAGRRVLYVDLDVHHGDGVQAIHAADPGVMTVSVHESGRYLFPGTGAASELGTGRAAGTVVNVPLEPMTGDAGWLAAVEAIVPALAATFGPEVVVSQHGSDSHAWDPLAHLRVTTTAMDRAARLVDGVAHRWGTGAWLATGGGGYDAYRVVPRAWAVTWLAGAHRVTPEEVPPGWRDRWTGEAERFGAVPLPVDFHDRPNAGFPSDPGGALADERAASTAAAVRAVVVPALAREAIDRGWWSATAWTPRPSAAPPADRPGGTPSVVGPLDVAIVDRLLLAPRVIAPADPGAALGIVRAALLDGAVASGAVVGGVLVALALLVPAGARGASGGPRSWRIAAVGVAPAHRGAGLGRGVLRRAVEAVAEGEPIEALATVAERDVVAPADVGERRRVAARLLASAGLVPVAPDRVVAAIDPGAAAAARPAR